MSQLTVGLDSTPARVALGLRRSGKTVWKWLLAPIQAVKSIKISADQAGILAGQFGHTADADY